MNLLNIVKHLLYLTQTEFGSENSSTTADEILTAERLFEVLKSINVSYFTELYTYDTLDLDNEYDELTNEEQSNDDINDYNENEHSDINDHFTLEEMEKIVEWVDQHPNAGLETISHRFKKVKYMYYITRFRQYIESNGTRLEKLNQIKEFMINEFYLKGTVEKESVHDADLELYAIQKARELNWNTFKASKSFINIFKKRKQNIIQKIQQNYYSN
ncbi:unnamed protein product [Rotaria sp. Silwood1]|nr:unnamed protein product [Rotaria sp. Silwood1]